VLHIVDDGQTQNEPIGAPWPLIAEEASAEQNGSDARAST
jgi:hypothetical protein